MAATPGKKIKQNVTTFEQTAQNLQSQAKADPLTNVLGGVSKNVTGATQKAAEGATQQAKTVAEGSGKDALGKAFTVNPAAYTPQKVTTPTVTPVATAQLPAGKPSTIETLSELPTAYTVDTTPGKADISNQVQTAKTGLSSQAATDYGTLSNAMDPITKMLQQQGQQTTDLEGNVIGSTAGVGQVAKQSDLETQAQMRDEALAAQRQNSNIDALALLLGVNYDPRTAALNSQIYGGQVAGLRGEAASRAEQQKAAEGARTSGLEQWLAETERGQQRVGDYTTAQQKEIDRLTEAGGKEADAQGEQALLDLETEAQNVTGKAKKETQQRVADGVSTLLDQEQYTSPFAGNEVEDLISQTIADSGEVAPEVAAQGGAVLAEALSSQRTTAINKLVKSMSTSLERIERLVALADKHGLQTSHPNQYRSLVHRLTSLKNNIEKVKSFKLPPVKLSPSTQPSSVPKSGTTGNMRGGGNDGQGGGGIPSISASTATPPSKAGNRRGGGNDGQAGSDAPGYRTIEEVLAAERDANKKNTTKPTKGGSN